MYLPLNSDVLKYLENVKEGRIQPAKLDPKPVEPVKATPPPVQPVSEEVGYHTLCGGGGGAFPPSCQAFSLKNFLYLKDPNTTSPLCPRTDVLYGYPHWFINDVCYRNTFSLVVLVQTSYTDIPIDGMRRTIAQRLTLSKVS